MQREENKEQMEQTEKKKYQGDRFNLKHIDNYIKCKWP